MSAQDRTAEFKTVLAQARRRLPAAKAGAQRNFLRNDVEKASLLSDAERAAERGGNRPRKSEFARRAASIGRGIASVMDKLEKLALLAKRKTLFDDRPVEINELTFVRLFFFFSS